MNVLIQVCVGIDGKLCPIVDGENFFLSLPKDISNITCGYREYDPYVLVPRKGEFERSLSDDHH